MAAITPKGDDRSAPKGDEDRAAPRLDLGARLRAERLRRGLSLREVARRLGVSASTVSQIETGKAQPSVSTLFDIVNLLGTSLDGLLAGHGPFPAGAGRPPLPGDRAGPPTPAGPEVEGFFSFQRSGEHATLELETGVSWRRLTAGSLPGIEFLHVTYAPGACSSSEGVYMRHAGQEFGYCLAGRLSVDVGFDSYELGPGDSISFPGTTPHRLGNPGQVAATAVWCVIGRHAH
jgi:transcriptional regulator with XRE-family HTH domain